MRIGAVVVALVVLCGCVREESGPEAECKWVSRGTGPVDAQGLSDEAERAEDIAIRYADGHVRPPDAPIPVYRATIGQCEEQLFRAVAADHGVTPEQVRDSIGKHRRTYLDVLTMGSFGALYALFVNGFVKRIWRRFPPKQDRWLGVLATAVIAPLVSVVGVAVGEFWSFKGESLRIGYGHLVFRNDRIPWGHHRVGIFWVGIAIFGLLSRLRYRDAEPERKEWAVRILTCMVMMCSAAFGQALRFEAADVQASAKTQHPGIKMTVLAPNVYQVKTATMVDLIAAAYGVEADKVVGGPNWLEMDRFDVVAKAPAGSSQQSLITTPQALRTMLQALLAERFGLAVHPDSRPMAAYVLSVGNAKPKLKEPDGAGPPGCQRQPGERAEIRCHGLTMEAFVEQLHGMAGDYLQNPVVDGTKLAGEWDFSLQWTPRGGLTAAGGDGITIFDAVEKQLGLKLEAKQAPAQVLVVDRVNRQPTANPAEAASLPRPSAPAFEVATIKPTDPQFGGATVQTPANGQIRIQGLTMSYLIQTMWFLMPEQIVGAPKWFDTDRWDITAKVATAAGGTPQMDMDSLIAMMKALLEDRFKLKTHMEERVAQAYTLTAVKAKLQRADASERSGCKEGPGNDGKDLRVTNPARSRLVTCRNMTTAEFAEMLPGIANALNQLNGVIRSAVMDATGLEGRYDFTLNWSQPDALRNRGPEAEPNGAITIEEAIASQLGLKLEITRRPTQVLVIDHVEEKPVEN